MGEGGVSTGNTMRNYGEGDGQKRKHMVKAGGGRSWEGG